MVRLAVGSGLIVGVAAVAALDLQPVGQGLAAAGFLLAALLVVRAFQRSLTLPTAAESLVLAASVGAVVALADVRPSQVVLYGFIGLLGAAVSGESATSFTGWWDRVPGPSKDPADYR